MTGFHETIPALIKRRIGESRPFLVISHPHRDPIKVTFATLDNAINRAAWFISESLPQDEDTFIWMSQSDVRYIVWALAAIKTGKAAVFPSSTNRVSANLLLFEDIGVKSMFYGPEVSASLGELVETASSTVGLKASPGLSLQEMLSPEPVAEYVFDKEFDDIKHTRFLGLHTSGTSGHPKPIWWTHGHFECLFAGMELDSILPEGISVENPFMSTMDGNTVLVVGPQYHAGALLLSMTAFRADMTVVILHPEIPPIPENLTSVINQNGVTSMTCPPVPIENMLSYPPGVEALSRLAHVGYVGGPINPILGAQLAKITKHLYSFYGSTEGGCALMDYSPNSENWDALRFVPIGQKMEEVLPGLYELVFPKTELIDRIYAFFRSYPELTEYRTKDLFAPVPGQEGWWRYRGRTDNWVAMSNGMKMDPTEFEAIVTARPDVKGAIVGGSHQSRLCLLVEVADDIVPTSDQERHDLLEKLWPTINEANQGSPKYGQIAKELVLFSSKAKPFLRAGKGTIQRQLTLKAYEDDIDALYDNLESGALADDIDPITSISAEGLAPIITQLYQHALNSPDISQETDLFARGLDSNAISITMSRLKASLRSFGIAEERLHGINIGMMYSYPTAAGLASTLATFLGDEPAVNGVASDGIAEMLEKYTPFATHPQRPQSVILTGSTGSLGTYILAALLALPETRIRRIFCLNRNPDARAAQAASLASRGLPPLASSPSDDSERVVFLTADLAAPNLGLERGAYDRLAAEATAIVHNAWPVNFLLPLAAFEPAVRGLAQGLLGLAFNAVHRPPVLFISSIAAAITTNQQQDTGTVVVPEAVLPSPHGLLPQGYGRSKYVCERLLNAYARATGRGAAILRVGQVAGPVAPGGTGVWNTAEWLPSLVRSSKYLGVLPRTLGSSSRVDWIPVDELSQIVLEVLEAVTAPEEGEKGGAKVYNLTNPTPVSWTDLLPALLEAGIASETVEFEEWIARVERSSHVEHAHEKALEENPAVKLLDFYRSLRPREGEDEDDYSWCVDNTLDASPTARALKPVNKEWMKLWVERWGF
ncbi:acetyl-CoA synthetase-like protein [Whalleya microplaca]|nr:acetyl-CoA synthetase-like protein [Whalleya microplaca]